MSCSHPYPPEEPVADPVDDGHLNEVDAKGRPGKGHEHAQPPPFEAREARLQRHRSHEHRRRLHHAQRRGDGDPIGVVSTGNGIEAHEAVGGRRHQGHSRGGDGVDGRRGLPWHWETLGPVHIAGQVEAAHVVQERHVGEGAPAKERVEVGTVEPEGRRKGEEHRRHGTARQKVFQKALAPGGKRKQGRKNVQVDNGIEEPVGVVYRIGQHPFDKPFDGEGGPFRAPKVAGKQPVGQIAHGAAKEQGHAHPAHPLYKERARVVLGPVVQKVHTAHGKEHRHGKYEGRLQEERGKPLGVPARPGREDIQGHVEHHHRERGEDVEHVHKDKALFSHGLAGVLPTAV